MSLLKNILKIKYLKQGLIVLVLSQLIACEQGVKKMSEQSNTECIVLLHGLGRLKSSMWQLEHYFKKQSYQVINQGYPSSRLNIEQLAEQYIGKAVKQCQNTSKIHFITHSLGGILLRQYLQNHQLPLGSRIVMLAPPNQGSEMATKLRNIFLFKWFTGTAGQQLTTTTQSIIPQLKPINFEVGIIAGNRSWIPFVSYLLKGNDDGVVSIEETKLFEMTDHIIVPHSHTFIMNFKQVIEQANYFIKQGHFNKKENPVKIGKKATFNLLEPALFSANQISMTQTVNAIYQNKPFNFITQIEIQPKQNKLIFIGISNLGVTLFKIIMQGQEIEFTGLEKVTSQLDPRRLLADFQLSLCSENIINQALNSAKLIINKNKTVEKRQLFENNLKLMEFVIVDKTIKIKHYQANYEIKIKTIDKKPSLCHLNLN